MKFQQRVNGVIVGTSDDKEKAIRAARKAALSVSDRRELVHVEVYRVNDDAGIDIENVHRDMISSDRLKELATDNLKPIGLVEFTKHVEKQNKTRDVAPLFEVGDYIILESELHQIVSVSESRAMAQPLRKKVTHIKDKFADKPDRVFTVKRKPVQLSPYASGVLSADEVKKELKKLEKENDELNKTGKKSSTPSSNQSGADHSHSGDNRSVSDPGE